MYTPLHAAITDKISVAEEAELDIQRASQIVNILLDHGASLHHEYLMSDYGYKKFATPLTLAIHRKKPELIYTILNSADKLGVVRSYL